MNDNAENLEAAARSWRRVVEPADGGLRLDRYWARELENEGVSRGKVKEWITSGLALVDGRPARKPRLAVLPGQELELRGATVAGGVGPEPGPLDVLHEDGSLVVVDKPAGLTTHPAPGEPDGTLVNRLLARWPDMDAATSGMDPQRPGVVHRLDKDTSGLIIAARTEAARLRLAADFAGRRVDKLYLALVHGEPKPLSGEVNLPIGRDPRHKTRMAVAEKGGREARSSYATLWTAPGGRASLVAVRIHTGRTHQVRVHMAALGCPLLGDAVYGARQDAEWRAASESPAPRQMLHAYALRFTHPASGERLFFRCEPPPDFSSLLNALAETGLRVGLVGPTGCGKSTVLRLLAERGLPTFSADGMVAELYAPGGDGAELVSRRFGPGYLLSGGGVDKAALFAAMRGSERFRREVMDLIHPLVRHGAESFFRAHRGGVAVAEVPLLLEGGWHKDGLVDVVAGVFCPEELRTGVFREARGLDPQTLAVFDSWQWPAERKRAECGICVENDAGMAELEQRAAELAGVLDARLEERRRSERNRVRGAMRKAAEEMRREGVGE